MNTRQTCLPWLPTSALPAWSQQLVVLSDGVSPDQRWNECGETCISSIAAAVWGARLSPDVLRASDGGPLRSGLTDGPALERMGGYANVVLRAHDLAASDARALLSTCLADGRPAIMLGTWPTPGGVLHWLLATESHLQGVSYINPWGGVRSSIPWSVFDALYAGTIVECRAHLHVDALAWPLPW